jgi:two-component system sensor histidine kinase KdpD
MYEVAMNSLRAGVLSADLRPIAVDAVVAEAILHTAGKADIDVDGPDNLPLALADPGLLERVLANLLANAVTASAADKVRVEGRPGGGRLCLQVIDHGPGLRDADRDRLFAPFQRLDDRGGAGSAWVWPSRVASPRRCAARSRRRTHRVGDSP